MSSTVVFDSLGNAISATHGQQDIEQTYFIAQSFTTAAGYTSAISDLQLGLQINNRFLGPDPSYGNIIVTLASSNSIDPGTPIATIGSINENSLPFAPNTPAVVDVSLTATPILQPNTTYWIELAGVNSVTT